MRLLPTIEKVLRNSAKARDSDKELITQVLQSMGAGLSPEQIDIIKRVNFESIRRSRQKLQEEGKYLPSPEVARQRRLKSYVMQQTMPKAKPAEVEQRIVLPWGQG